MRTIKKGIFFAAIISIGVAVGFVISARTNFSNNVQAVQEQKPVVLSDTTFENAVFNVADSVGKAVVSISVEITEKIPSRSFGFGSSPFNQFGEDDFMKKFFEDFFGEIPEREYKQKGLGSGVIIDKEGHILTNEHVIKNADKIIVTLPDGRESEAEVKGADPRSDLAIIKIKEKDLPVAGLGDSDELKIGQWVVAIGNPFGSYLNSPEPTVTVGVVSALHRTLGVGLRRETDYGDLIQTDAAINPGNSGGPLVNLKGEVVGINAAIFSTSGGYQGIGFAIPINVAKRIISNLIKGKKISYGWLGVTVQNLDDDLAGKFGVDLAKGALIAKVLADSPADKAGLKEGDIIVGFEKEQVEDIRELIRRVGRAEVGKKVNLKVIRNKKSINIKVALGERPDMTELEGEVVQDKTTVSWRGIVVAEITPQVSKLYDLKDTDGVVIVNIGRNTPASEALLVKGDLIFAIENKKLSGLKDFEKITGSIEKKSTALMHTSRGYTIINAEE